MALGLLCPPVAQGLGKLPCPQWPRDRANRDHQWPISCANWDLTQWPRDRVRSRDNGALQVSQVLGQLPPSLCTGPGPPPHTHTHKMTQGQAQDNGATSWEACAIAPHPCEWPSVRANGAAEWPRPLANWAPWSGSAPRPIEYPPVAQGQGQWGFPSGPGPVPNGAPQCPRARAWAKANDTPPQWQRTCGNWGPLQ